MRDFGRVWDELDLFWRENGMKHEISEPTYGFEKIFVLVPIPILWISVVNRSFHTESFGFCEDIGIEYCVHILEGEYQYTLGWSISFLASVDSTELQNVLVVRYYGTNEGISVRTCTQVVLGGDFYRLSINIPSHSLCLHPPHLLLSHPLFVSFEPSILLSSFFGRL